MAGFALRREAFRVAGMNVTRTGAGNWGEGTRNRLAESNSPYLLQHAGNPVDWYPWGEEAFGKARREGKPILLSIGYSTCHWCHVMERESYEDEEVADYLNAHCVSIKLDREERPDVDRVYMTAFQAMFGQGGGWPLNMFLTPDLKPFFGGTYFPPRDRLGRPGFLTVLKRLGAAWRDHREEVVESAERIHARLKEALEDGRGAGDGPEDLEPRWIEEAREAVMAGADLARGGWGRGPKFPQPSHLRFLLRAGDREEREFVLRTCREMMAGGIHDQLGGGFHRYAVDGIWLVPHFEKMLYDQAQLLDVYVEAWRVSRDAEFREVAEGIGDYVLRELRHPRGGFFSAQDAQSEGKEGKYWCWTQDELRELLSEEEFETASRWFGITREGNFLDHSDPEALRGQNVLHRAGRRKERGEAERERLCSAIGKMREARSRRVPPATDDKILASWNGLMIAAMARAGRVLGEGRFLEAARRAHAFVTAELWDEEEPSLGNRWREGRLDRSQLSESYLFLMRGSRTLYEATLATEYLEFAVALAEEARRRFYDEEKGGFFDGEGRDDVVIRMKGDFDSATPTPGSVGVVEYLILAWMTGRGDFLETARKTLRGAGPVIESSPMALAESLRGLDMYLRAPPRLVIAGAESREAFLQAAWQGAVRPLVLGNEGPVGEFERRLAPVNGRTTAYYCAGQTCRAPETDPGRVAAWLSGDASS